MTCAACYRESLPGGVRCTYCGTHFPPVPTFDLGDSPTEGAISGGAATALPGQTGSDSGGFVRRAGWIGSLLLLVFKAKSLLALLQVGKIAVTLSSMAVFIWVDALLFGWKFGVGIALSILVHEMGHVIVNWRKGVQQTAPMFIPFVGALILVKRFPNNPAIESESGAGGPIAGAVAALFCLAVAKLTGSPYWLALAHIGFAINLFNLLPFPPLDGSHIAAVFSPRIWSAVLIVLLLYLIKVPSPILWPILVVGFLMRLGQKDHERFLLAPPTVRVRMALIFVALCIGLAWGADHTQATRQENRQAATHQSVGAAADLTQHPAAAAGSATVVSHVPTLAASSARWMLRLALFAAAALLWLWVARLLASAVGWRSRNDALRFVAGPLLVFLLMYAVILTLPTREAVDWQLIGGFFAGTGAALLYAICMAIRLQGAVIARPPAALLRTRALFWAVGGVLLLAYTINSAPVCLIVIGGLIAFGLRHPWTVNAALAGLYESLGDIQRAIRHSEHAATQAADPELQGLLWQEAAGRNLLLCQGAAAWQALERAWPHLAQSAARRGDALARRGTINALMGRFDAAIADCEALLRIGSGNAVIGPAVYFITQALLAEIASYRGWHDEARARAEWCLNAAPNASAPTRAWLHLRRAAALAEDPGTLNTAAAVEAEIEAALRASREPRFRALAEMIEAEQRLRDNDADGALSAAEQALRLLPGHLQMRFVQARARCAVSPENGRQELAALAAAFPEDLWGQRAGESVS